MAAGAGPDGGTDSSCEMVKSYSYHTLTYFSSYPQPTIFTSTILKALPTPTASPELPQEESNSNQSFLRSTPQHQQPRRTSKPYSWYNVVALELITTIAICPPASAAPPPSPTPPDPIPDPGSPTNTQSMNHSGVNVHRALLAGALATCIIVILLAGGAAITIILWRRTRRRATDDDDPLQDIDETSTTLSSVPSERCRDRLESYSANSPNWIITPTLQAHLPPRASSHLGLEGIETITRPRAASFVSGWQMNSAVLSVPRSKSPSITISEDSHAPSFFPGDEARFLSVPTRSGVVRHMPSVSALSCAATIASESAASATPLPTLTNSTVGSGSLGPAMASLIDHKTFIRTMMAVNAQAEVRVDIQDGIINDDDGEDGEIERRRRRYSSSRCNSFESEMGQSTESTYWNRRA